MPQGPDGNTIIIVKKVAGHGGHHGGSWKVALADFMTSMMAFFMVMWLVNTASVVTRENIASYFKQPGIFEKGSGTPLELGENGVLREAFAPMTEGNSAILPDKNIYRLDVGGDLRTEGFIGGIDNKAGRIPQANVQEMKDLQKEEFGKVAKEVKKAVQLSNTSTLGDVSVKVDEVGFHLEIMDTPTDSMFASGSAHIMDTAEEQLKKIATLIKSLPNPIDMAGHTDAKPFKKGLRSGYDNWDLSTDRANAARRVFIMSGIPEEQIRSVVGYADKKPKKPEEPLHASNRRISVSLRYSAAATALLEQRAKDKLQPLKDKLIAPLVVSSSSSSAKAEKAVSTSSALPVITANTGAQNSSSSSSIVEADKFKDQTSAASSTAATLDKDSPTVTEGKKTPSSANTTVVKTPIVEQGKKVTPLREANAASSANSFSPIVPKMNSSEEPLWQRSNLIFGDKNPFSTDK
ncbi:MAG: OmpA family protein [Deltaproteobacteria bacterium]|nr:OmpA family protein [Deltaproteobacteria bacterium]